tara:strand:+ start:1144 stop:2397 length:1254 start_codon:yes stop_codon:yes gene_type:complete
MGSIVKKIKKTVKKVIKKNPISKIISKTAKKIKRFGRKVWEGIKKVGGKAMKAWGKISQKIGPIGTIALSFAMPYLLGPLSGAAGTAWNNMATWLGTPATGAGSAFVNTFKNLGLNVMKGTQFVGSTFKGITQTLSKTIGSFGQGDIAGGFSNLWKGAGDVFSGRAGFGTADIASKAVVDASLGLNTQVQQATGTFLREGASGVVQTGGVNMLNANIANAQSYKIISNAMASTVSGYTPEMSKYVNTLQKQYKLDAFTAHEHAMKNGGVINIDPTNQATTYNLDFNSSGDFKFQQSGGPPNAGEYQYTGDASKISFGETNQYVGMRGNQYEIKGETYGYGDAPKSDSLLNKGSKALSAMLNNDDNQELEIPGGVNPSLDPYSTLYGGTNVASAGGGQFLTQAQQQFFVEQDLNIARG